MIVVCLTHDIDRIDKTYQYITKPLRALKAGNIKLFLKRCFSPLYVRNPYWGFDKIMEIEEKYGVRSTCFFLNESITFNIFKPKEWKLSMGRYDIHDIRIIKIIKVLDKGGWEIGVHGSFLSNNNNDLLKKEKQTLESIVGHEVLGIRQHYLNFTENTFEIHNNSGFKYDSTWGLTNGIGFKDEKIRPFFPIEASDYCEIPMTIMDGPFASCNNKWEEFYHIIDIIDKNNSYLVINYHNCNLDPLDFPSYEEDYIKMIKILKEKNSVFMTMREAYNNILEKKKKNDI